MSARPLTGLKVLEFTHTIMGPTAGLLFAELGADVVKVEPAPNGDHTRRLGGFGAGFFAAFNRNKRSLAIDLKHPDGKSVLQRLIAKADVLVTNIRPAALARLGFGETGPGSDDAREIAFGLAGAEDFAISDRYEKGGTTHVAFHAETREGLFELWVANVGEPIPPESIDKLFEPFFRGKVRASREGLGLGLYIASQIAKAHGGTLTVASGPDETRFTFSMPLVAAGSGHPLSETEGR